MYLPLFFLDYPHGITLVTPVSGSEKKQVLHFCALGAEEMQKFVEDLKESIAEVMELEQIRIECKAPGAAQTPCSHSVCMYICLCLGYFCLSVVGRGAISVFKEGQREHEILSKN